MLMPHDDDGGERSVDCEGRTTQTAVERALVRLRVSLSTFLLLPLLEP